MSDLINKVPKVEFPVVGQDLALAVRVHADQIYADVKSELEWKHLPNGLNAIWNYSPLFEAVRKLGPNDGVIVRKISHIIVTFPGATATKMLREMLIENQLVPPSDTPRELAHELASELFALTMRYSKVQNMARHIRTAVNAHLKVLEVSFKDDRVRFNYLQTSPSLDQEKKELLETEKTRLRQIILNSEAEVHDWTNSLEDLLNLVSGNAPLASEGSDRQDRLIGPINSRVINSYSLRFRQVVASTLGIDSLNKVTFSKISTKTIEEQLKELNQLPEDHMKLYQVLEESRPKRVIRPDFVAGEVAFDFKRFNGVPRHKNLQKHILNIGGRELIIEGSPRAFTETMIAGVLKSLDLQFSLDSHSRRLVAAFESDEQLLRIRIQDPLETDHEKVKKILWSLLDK